MNENNKNEWQGPVIGEFAKEALNKVKNLNNVVGASRLGRFQNAKKIHAYCILEKGVFPVIHSLREGTYNTKAEIDKVFSIFESALASTGRLEQSQQVSQERERLLEVAVDRYVKEASFRKIHEILSEVLAERFIPMLLVVSAPDNFGMSAEEFAKQMEQQTSKFNPNDFKIPYHPDQDKPKFRRAGYFNDVKHKETCAKNKRKRKKRK